ncbi:MAG: hypothetical protein FWF90_17450 [Promicromonosporaceae bacterium]|nr:hypothetical protein [Promicromonosporaceae bacterium]
MSAATIRTIASDEGVSVSAALRLLELEPANHDVDEVLRPRVEWVYRAVLASQLGRSA